MTSQLYEGGEGAALQTPIELFYESVEMLASLTLRGGVCCERVRFLFVDWMPSSMLQKHGERFRGIGFCINGDDT